MQTPALFDVGIENLKKFYESMEGLDVKCVAKPELAAVPMDVDDL